MRPHGGGAAAALLTTAKALFWVQACVDFAGAVPVPSAARDTDNDDDYYHHAQTLCEQVAPYLRRVNALTIAQSVVGGAGLVLCGVAVLHTTALGKDRRSLAARLVLGVMLSNLMYAATDIVPVNLYQLSGVGCGDQVIGPRDTDVVAGCLPTAVMFFAVYCTTMYELMMVLVSTHALRTGEGDIPQRRERALHLGCVGTGAAALLGYYLRCRAIELELIALVAAAGPDPAAWTSAQNARADQLSQAGQALPGILWGVALAPVVAAALVWAYQRHLYNELLREWDEAKARHDEFQRNDDLAMLGLDASIAIKARLLQLRKVAYTEVVVPLERYVAVILLFTIPQIVAVTDMCQSQTEAAFQMIANAEAALPCENVAEFVLAWRAIALGVAYFWASEVRDEAVHIPDLCRRAWNRLSGTGGPGGARARFPANELDGVALVPTEGEGRSSAFGNADSDIERMGSMASKTLTGLDLAKAAVEAEAEGGRNIGEDPANSSIRYEQME